MPDNKYCYPGTDILINKMNLRDNELLEAAERELSVRRVNQLINNPIHGSFDFSWAGEERTVNIAKSNMFCNVMFLDQQTVEIFRSPHNDNFFKGLSWNALHPFREGNGRAQREFFRKLALEDGHEIDFSVITEDEMILYFNHDVIR